MFQEEDNDMDDTKSRKGGRSQPPRRMSTASAQINERDLSSTPPKKYRGGFITRASVQQLLRCQSPSSASTTSLAQLRDKLNQISIHFPKEPTRIAVAPKLPVLREENEDVLSDSFVRKRYGVALKRPYHSDNEILPVTTKTRYIAPVIEEPAPSLALVAALATTDQSMLNKTFDRLYKNNPQFDLCDSLVNEALKHGQDKDSGIIAGKVYDSDIVEDTPVEEPIRKKKLMLKRQPKEVLENKSTTDDSDVVNDTPCHDYVWKKRGASVRENVNKNDVDEIETLNSEAVNALFSLGSIIIDEEIGEKEVSVNNLVIETDILDCVNDMLDKVCNDLDVCVDILVEQQQHIDSCKKSKTPKKGSKSTKEMSTNNETVAGKTVTQKQVRKMNPTLEKKTKPVKKQNNTEEDSVLKDNTNAQSPTKELIRRKRKLYSPKDDDNENNEIPKTRKERRPSTSTECPIAACYIELENVRKSRIRLPRKRASTQLVVSPKTKKLNDMFDSIKDNVVNDEKITIVAKKSDKDFSHYNLSSESDEEAFKNKKIQVQKRISSSSLESKRERRKSAKPVNYSSYFSSEDEGETALKPKKLIRERRKSAKPVNYSSYFSSEDEGETVLKPKKVKKTETKSRKIKTPNINLIDERMRKPQPEVQETSFVEENIETYISEEPEPALNKVPVLETIPPVDLHEQPIVSKSKIKTPNKSYIIKIKTENNLRKKCEKLSKSTGRMKREINKNGPTEGDSATVSPLPGLVVETEPPKDDLTSSIEANLLQKFKKIYRDDTDLSGTQNLNANNNNNYGIETVALSQHSLINLDNYDDNTIDPKEKLQTVDLSNGSQKSIKTVGRSPITAHNNPDESPPNIDALNESFQHRDVHIEGMSKSITEFLDDMRTQLRNSKAASRSTSPVIPITTRLSTKDSMRSNVGGKKVSSDESIEKPISTPKSVRSNIRIPKVVLKRMSSDEIESHLNSSTPKSKADEIKKILTPTKSNTTRSPIIVIQRVSSDEINRWRPVPETMDVDKDLNKYDIRKTTPKGITARRTSSRPKSLTRSCVTCETSKPKISPIKLNFDVVDLTGFRARTLRGRSCSIVTDRKRRINRSKSSAEEQEKDDAYMKSSQKSVLKIRSEKLKSAAKAEKGGEVIDLSQDIPITSSAETADIRSREKIFGSPTDASEIIKNVKDWIQRNSAAVESCSGDCAAKREIYLEVMQAIDTRLVEINESYREAMTAAFLKDQEELTSLLARFKTMIEKHQKNTMDRACAIIREDAQKKARMIQILKQDIESILKYY